MERETNISPFFKEAEKMRDEGNTGGNIARFLRSAGIGAEESANTLKQIGFPSVTVGKSLSVYTEPYDYYSIHPKSEIIDFPEAK
jgi:hypothetical protein